MDAPNLALTFRLSDLLLVSDLEGRLKNLEGALLKFRLSLPSGGCLGPPTFQIFFEHSPAGVHEIALRSLMGEWAKCVQLETNPVYREDEEVDLVPLPPPVLLNSSAACHGRLRLLQKQIKEKEKEILGSGSSGPTAA